MQAMQAAQQMQQENAALNQRVQAMEQLNSQQQANFNLLQQYLQKLDSENQQFRAAAASAAAPRANPPSAFRPEKPGPFTGDMTEDPETWLEKAEDYFELVGETDAKRMIQGSAQHFPTKSAARSWYKSTLRDDAMAGTVTWKQFKDQLIARFRPIDSSTTARLEMMNLTARRWDNIQRYTARFMRVNERIQDMNEKDRILNYQRGLPKWMLTHLVAYEPERVQDLISRANKLDQQLAQNSNRQQTGNRWSNQRYENRNYASQDNTSAPMELGNVNTNRWTPRQGGLSKDQHEKLLREGKCFTCHQTGHQSRNCPKRTVGAFTSSSKRPQNGRRQNGGRGARVNAVDAEDEGATDDGADGESECNESEESEDLKE